MAQRAAAANVSMAQLVDESAGGNAAGEVLQAKVAEVKHVPTQIERDSDQESLRKIRARYGSRAQTLINALLAFDAYFRWWYPFKKSIPFMAPMEVREQRALENCRAAIDMHEIYERISINNHGSYLPHGATFKVSRDILLVGDVWAVGQRGAVEGCRV